MGMKIPPQLCMVCRGGKLLCGLTFCPIEVANTLKPRVTSVTGNEVYGSSPPSVFVGRHSYPKVRVYPSAPPVVGDTMLYEDSGRWLSMDMEEFLSMRLSLLRGGMQVRDVSVANPDYTMQEIQVMAISSRPVEIDMRVSKPFSERSVRLSEDTPPMGPSAPLQKIAISESKADQRVEKAFYDTDLLASEAMSSLYRSGVTVSQLTRALSVGALGTGRRRRLVPTRWAITAVDSTLSDALVRRIKGYSELGEFLVFRRETPGNLFVGILAPSTWRYEWGEAWFPGSTWNLWGTNPEVMIDYEDYRGRDTYPDIGGCYYAARLAVAEYLDAVRRQAAPILWREIYPSFNLPVGVWYVRENLREMFRSKPERFSSLAEALRHASIGMRVPLEKWVSRSHVVKALRSVTLDHFMGDMHDGDRG